MKKMYFLMLPMLPLFMTVSAQQQTRDLPDPAKDHRVIGAYKVRIIPATGSGLGYDIMQENKMLLHQFQNPMPYLRKGILKREDAFKVAEWAIKDYEAHKRWSTVVPANVARELKLEIR